jgi:hypothetical protein
METPYWVGLLAALVALVGILVAIEHFNKTEQNKRIEDFVQEFRNHKENCGRENISALSLSGLNSLRSDHEYRIAFERIKGLILHHPLLKWKDDIEKIGYTNFFHWVSSQGGLFTAETIDQLLSDYKKK